MSTSIDLAPGVGDVITIPLSGGADPQSASVASLGKNIAPCKGRVVGVAAWVLRVGGGTLPTDVDVMIEKGTTDLHTIIDCWGSSTDNGPQMGTLSTTATEVAVAAGDIFHMDTTITGGGSVTIQAVEGMVWMVRE